MGLADFIEQLGEADIQHAAAMSGSLKLRAGGDLFDEACRWTLAGIRAQYPHMSHAQALDELRRRIETPDPSEFF